MIPVKNHSNQNALALSTGLAVCICLSTYVTLTSTGEQVLLPAVGREVLLFKTKGGLSGSSWEITGRSSTIHLRGRICLYTAPFSLKTSMFKFSHFQECVCGWG